jgi:hypothetical protein
MTTIPLPRNYGSIEGLDHWLKKNIPHEYHIDGSPRWRILAGPTSYWIGFARESDVTFFNLIWLH